MSIDRSRDEKGRYTSRAPNTSDPEDEEDGHEEVGEDNQSNMAPNDPVLRPIKYEDIMGNQVDLDSQYIICYECYQADKYIVQGKHRRTNDGEKPTLVGVAGTEGTNFIITKKDPDEVGVLLPKKRGVTRKSMEDFRLDKHIIDPDNSCTVRDEEFEARKIDARERLKKFDTKQIEDDKKKWYTYKDEYPKFSINMTAADLKRSLAKANEIYTDSRWRWTTILRLELLTKDMSNDLKLKIKTDKGIDPEKRSEWKYEDLEEAIKKHAVNTEDPMKLARNFANDIKGKDIDDTNTRIENWFEEMELASQGVKGNKVGADRRRTAEGMYQNAGYKDMFKHLLLRHSLTPDIAETVRTFEISSNESLGLPNNELIEFVRRLEKNNNKENKENVNRMYDNFNRSNQRNGDQGKTLRFEEFNRIRKELLGKLCARCGDTAKTDQHPRNSCDKVVKCNVCGKDSHIERFCVRKAMKNRGRVNAMSYEGQSCGSDDEEDTANAIRENHWDTDEEEESESHAYVIYDNNESDIEDTSDEEETKNNVYMISNYISSESEQENNRTRDEKTNMKKKCFKKKRQIMKTTSPIKLTPAIRKIEKNTTEDIQSDEEWFRENETIKDSHEEDSDDIRWKLSELGTALNIYNLSDVITEHLDEQDLTKDLEDANKEGLERGESIGEHRLLQKSLSSYVRNPLAHSEVTESASASCHTKA